MFSESAEMTVRANYLFCSLDCCPFVPPPPNVARGILKARNQLPFQGQPGKPLDFSTLNRPAVRNHPPRRMADQRPNAQYLKGVLTSTRCTPNSSATCDTRLAFPDPRAPVNNIGTTKANCADRDDDLRAALTPFRIVLYAGLANGLRGSSTRRHSVGVLISSIGTYRYPTTFWFQRSPAHVELPARSSSSSRLQPNTRAPLREPLKRRTKRNPVQAAPRGHTSCL